jgi:hypothetical protein
MNGQKEGGFVQGNSSFDLQFDLENWTGQCLHRFHLLNQKLACHELLERLVS